MKEENIMFKRLLALSLFLVMVLAVSAIPARRGQWKVVRTADGSEVRVELRGDEHAHYWAAEDGRWFEPIGKSDIYQEVSHETILERAAASREKMGEAQAAHRAAAKKATIGGAHDPYVGTKKCLVVLVNFADTKFQDNHDLDYYERMTNEEGFTDENKNNTHSVRDFYHAQSNNQLDVEFDVVGPVQLKYGYAYYGANDAYGNDALVYKMIIEAVEGAYAAGKNFADYDWDGDGIVDQVFVLFAGLNAATYHEDDDLIWPHMYYLSSYGETRRYDGVTIDTYACSGELVVNDYEEIVGDGIGSMCHEFSHCMGLPDAYDTGSANNYGMMKWSVMDYGVYNGDNCGFLPAGYTAYERMYCGWLDPIELTEETVVEGMKGLTEGGESYIIYNKGNTNEYYLLENRTAYDFDAGLPGFGMLITHLDYHATLWRANMVNTTTGSGIYANDHQRYTILACDNDYSQTTKNMATDVWPDGGVTHLGNYSIPAATTYNINTDGKYLMNITLSDIAKADDGTISFCFYPTGIDPNHGNPPENAIFYESFDYCAGTGGNDGEWGDNTGKGTFDPDNDGWSGASLHGAYECAMFGSNTQRGNVLTPTFSIDEETIFSFRIAPYKANIAGSATLSCENDAITLSETELTFEQGKWTDYNITLTGAGDVTIRFRESSGINRFFLDEVAAVPARLSGIKSVENNISPKSRGVYSLDGIYLGENIDALKKGVYIVDGKKVIR